MTWFKKKKYAYLEDELSLGKQIFIFGWEIFKVVVISLAIIIPVRYFLIKPFYVKGASMEPNFHNYEYLIINEIGYHLGEPKRGDVVVFKYPLDPREFFIKRVIGLPNETIKIIDGKVYIIPAGSSDFELLVEDYLLPATQTAGRVEVELGSDEYYILGDNREASLDSRMFGPVKREAIIGKALLRGWPINRVGLLLNEIDYNL